MKSKEGKEMTDIHSKICNRCGGSGMMVLNRCGLQFPIKCGECNGHGYLDLTLQQKQGLMRQQKGNFGLDAFMDGIE
jgi:DnaJ-class molecular chaperone